MARKNSAERPLRLYDKVVAVTSLPQVPEGTTGKIMVADGLTWVRYWVKWDNGIWLGSIGADKLVRADRWEEYQRRRAEEAARPKEVAAVAATPAPGEAAAEAAPAPPATGAASRVPAHLLERARQAKERAAAKG